jgi:hypothetical protein
VESHADKDKSAASFCHHQGAAWVPDRHHDTQHNDMEHNDTQRNNIQQSNKLTQNYDSFVLLSDTNKPFALSVIMLSVVVPPIYVVQLLYSEKSQNCL